MRALKIRIRADGLVTERTVDLDRDLTYDQLFMLLNIKPETVVALLEGHPVSADDLVEAKDLEIVRVVSSG